jgi:hypothetical protein
MTALSAPQAMRVRGEIEMDRNASLARVKRVGTGVCFVVFPLLFVFAFAAHPGLLNPHLLGPEEKILRAHNASMLQFGHVLVTLSMALLVVIAVHFMKLLDRTPFAWAGIVGAAVGLLGAILMAAEKGALCLTMSAVDTVPASQFAEMMPGLVAMFSFEGWMALLMGIVLLPLGFAILAIGLLMTRALPRWQSALFLVGVLFVGFPDGAEIVNLSASVLMGVALVPYGVRLLAGVDSAGSVTTAAAHSVAARGAHQDAGAGSPPVPSQACAGCRRRGRLANGAA